MLDASTCDYELMNSNESDSTIDNSHIDVVYERDTSCVECNVGLYAQVELYHTHFTYT